MTFTYKLARRLARLRKGPALLLPLLAACAAGEPTPPPDPTTPDSGTDGPVAVSPRQVTLEGSQGVLFRAFESLIPGSSQVTSIEWTTTGGRVDASGNYTSTSTGAFKVVGRRKGNPHNQPDTSVVVVVPPQPTLVSIDLTPSTATVGGGLQQQFAVVGRRSDGSEVPIGVNWTATGGTIDAGGLYTAGRTAGTYKVIAIHVTTGLADTAIVTVPPATLTSITLSPSSVFLGAGQGQQFRVSGRLSDGTTTPVPVAYSATGGTISVNGYYTAGGSGGTFRVIATAQGGKADTSAVTITSSPPPPTSGVLLYNADLESGTWPDGTGFWRGQLTSDGVCEWTKRIGIYTGATKPFATAPSPRRGTRAVMLRTLANDVYPCTPTQNARSTAESPRVMVLGGEYWIAESVYFPTDFPSLPSWFMFMELYSPVAGGQPAVAAYLSNGGANISFNAAYDAATLSNHTIASFPTAKGQWHDFLYHVKISTDPTGGFVELWHNGSPVTFTNGKTRYICQTMLAGHATGGMNFHPSNYRRAGSPAETVVYFDEMKVGTSREVVDIPR